MNIIYNKNPLRSTIELDEMEKKLLWHKIKINEMEEMLFSAHFHLQKDKHFDLEKAKEAVDPDYYCTDEQSKLDKRCDMLLEHFIEELNSFHAGDCTCVPCSCSKCHAESLLGIDTIKGLGKHSAYKIDGAFGKDNEKSIDEAIEVLVNYKTPIKGAGWEKFTQEQFEQHIPRWRAEAKAAADWLINYKKEHFPNGS